MVKWIACVCLLVSVAFGQDGVRKMYEKARLLEERNKDLTEALRLYGEVVRQGKAQRALAAQAQYERGVVLLRLRRTAEALQAFRALITDFPEESTVVGQARARLSALAPAPGPITRRLFDDDDADFITPSPDGRYFAYTDSSSGDLMARDIVTGEARHVTGEKKSREEFHDQAIGSVFSPSGRRLAYLWQTEAGVELRIINFDGTGDRLLARVLDIHTSLLDWSPDEGSLLARRREGLATISVASGAITPLNLKAGPRVGSALFSRDGKWVVFDAPSPPDGNTSDIYAVSLADGTEATIVEHPRNDRVAGWSPDGTMLVFTSDRTDSIALWGVRVTNGRPQGEPQLLLNETGNIAPLGISRKGALYYIVIDVLRDVYMATLDLDAGSLSPAKQANPRSVGRAQHPAWSPDGDFLAWDAGVRGEHVLLIQSRRTGQIRELRPKLTRFGMANWHPANGRIVVTGADASGSSGFYAIDPATGDASLLLSEAMAETNFEGAWSPDGGTLFARLTDWKTGLFAIALDGSKRALFVPPADSNLGQDFVSASPDGKLLAFGLGDYPAKGEISLMLVPAAGGEARRLLRFPRSNPFLYGAFTWTPDSRQIVMARKSGLSVVSVADGSTREIAASVHEPMMLRLSPDGKTLAFVQGVVKGHLYVIENFLPSGNGTRGR